MTDAKELVERLTRGWCEMDEQLDAAGLIEAQAKELEELRKQN